MANNPTLDDLLQAVRRFHHSQGIPIGDGPDLSSESRKGMLHRLSLMMGELGEVADAVTKHAGQHDYAWTDEALTHTKEELIDVLYVWLGTAIHLGWSAEEIEDAFFHKHQINMQRGSRHGTPQLSP